MRIEELQYSSSVDGTAPLFADAAFATDGRPKPVVAVMHGYSGDRTNVAKDLRDFAQRGLFAIAPDMRGRGTSAGRWDSGGRDVHDIVDALLAAMQAYPAEIDCRNVNIIGYSGGGGNCFAAMVRFPDLFHVVAPFFGISDYGLWYETRGRPDCNEVMVATLGGTPEDLPEVYAARNACLGARNSPGSRLHVFWDEDEKACPPILNEKFLAAYCEAGLTNATAHVSRVGDQHRWHHGYRTDNPMLEKADEVLCEEMLREVPDLSLPPKGTLTVCGYLVTRYFQVFVEDGDRGVVTVNYDLTGETPVIRVTENPRAFKVNIAMQTPLSTLSEISAR